MMTDEDMKEFVGNYFKFDYDKDYDVVVANWQVASKTFSKEEGAKKVVTFELLKVNGEEHTSQPLQWSTRSTSFLRQAWPYLKKAQDAKQTATRLLVRYNRDKTYSVMGGAL